MSGFLIGQIALFAGSRDLLGWELCDGSILSVAQHQPLFSVIGNTYGGNASEGTFAVPDLRGRVPIQQGTGPGLSPYPLGDTGGVETVALTTDQIPSHTHAATSKQPVNPEGSNTDDPSNAVPANTGSNNFSTTAGSAFLSPASTTIENTGGGQSHTNIQPYLALNYFINHDGNYPVYEDSINTTYKLD